MHVKVVLFGILRERLAKESRGRLTVELPEAATIHELLAKLDVQMSVICSLNGEIERNFDHPLKDGDEAQIFRPAGGGGSASGL
jgi:sulfur carrier protein ThiS